MDMGEQIWSASRARLARSRTPGPRHAIGVGAQSEQPKTNVAQWTMNSFSIKIQFLFVKALMIKCEAVHQAGQLID